MFNITPFSDGLVRLLDDKMREHNITARDLAKRAGCDQGLICHIRRKGHVPQRDTLHSIGVVLDCPDQLLIAGGYIPSPNWQPKVEAERIYHAYAKDFAQQRVSYYRRGLELATSQLEAYVG